MRFFYKIRYSAPRSVIVSLAHVAADLFGRTIQSKANSSEPLTNFLT